MDWVLQDRDLRHIRVKNVARYKYTSLVRKYMFRVKSDNRIVKNRLTLLLVVQEG